jgi:TDG/mug DNA glycosylase family protein
MSRIEGFPPLARPDARLLVLGSMPSRESLARAQYYAHPRNAFWPIMTRLFDLHATRYAARAAELTAHGVAVWDVLKACTRDGSLDSAIDDASIETNDFDAFYRAHPNIRHVFFNGAKAESVYRRRVLPRLDPAAAALPCRRLPSTSPAHASLDLQQKTAAWGALLRAALLESGRASLQ